MACTTQTLPATASTTRAKELANTARRLLEDFKALEAGMEQSSYCQCGHNVSVPAAANQCPPTAYCDPRSSSAMFAGTEGKQVTPVFTSFCENLLYTNRVWKQQREIRTLRESLKATEEAKSSNAFKSFCDKLLLTNRIWKLERQVEELTAEGERNKRARVSAITHAAKRMAMDVRKEAMIEEFVLELLKELRENEQALAELREAREMEVREMQGDWLKEYRRLVHENERLHLALNARQAEQDVSNELEQSLHDNLVLSRKRIRELEEGVQETAFGETVDKRRRVSTASSTTAVADDDDEMDDLTEVDEGMSTMSSATCVSIEGTDSSRFTKFQPSGKRQRHSSPAIWSKSSQQSALEKWRSSHQRSIPLRKLDTTPYAGFSFNPLFFGHPETLVVSPSRTEKPETPVKLALKIAPASAPSIRERKESNVSRTSKLRESMIANAKGPWKF